MDISQPKQKGKRKKKNCLTNLVTVLYVNQEVTLDMMDIGVICVFV
jgi:hypothetical protein